MNPKSSVFVTVALLLIVVPASLQAATARKLSKEELQSEYVSVRKIALKDPKVIWAFERANKRLNERILEIDPALVAIVNAPPSVARPVPVTPRPRRKVVAAASIKTASEDTKGTYTVKKGDTLTSIAESNKSTVSAIEKANALTDESKLKVGQKLVLPATTTITSEPAKAKAGESAWDRLKSLYP